jgi:hypothetical protein
MRRIGLAIVLTVGLTLAPLTAEAEKSEKMARVGILGVGPAPGAKSVTANPFWLSMRRVGWVAGPTPAFSSSGHTFSEASAEVIVALL